MEPTRFTSTRIDLMNVSAYLIHDGTRAMLIDCGRRGSEGRILRAMQGEGLLPGALELLVLTHAHFDHAGSAAALKRETGCRIMVHASESDRLQRGRTPMPKGTRWKARLLTGMGRPFSRFIMSYGAVEADFAVEGNFSLKAHGFPGRIWHTPGHTPGSMSVEMPGGEVYCGDAVFGLTGKELFPPYAEDVDRLLESWRFIAQLDCRELFPAHGRPARLEVFRQALGPAIEKYGRSAS